AEDGIRDRNVTGVQTCALPISLSSSIRWEALAGSFVTGTIFYFVEKKKQDPFIDIKALQTNKNANIIYLLFLLINFVYYNYFYRSEERRVGKECKSR